ncbi:hypothetical protein C8J56DRAFT_1052098 [Mycena floridula]|nr:hypothetical protein C8J56DRAFT_1052098 [Mycena floridula]
MVIPEFSLDLIQETIGHLWDDKSTLAAASCLVSKEWRLSAVIHLFSTTRKGQKSDRPRSVADYHKRTPSLATRTLQEIVFQPDQIDGSPSYATAEIPCIRSVDRSIAVQKFTWTLPGMRESCLKFGTKLMKFMSLFVSSAPREKGGPILSDPVEYLRVNFYMESNNKNPALSHFTLLTSVRNQFFYLHETYIEEVASSANLCDWSLEHHSASNPHNMLPVITSQLVKITLDFTVRPTIEASLTKFNWQVQLEAFHLYPDSQIPSSYYDLHPACAICFG